MIKRANNLHWLDYAAYFVIFIAIIYIAFSILKPGFPSGHDIAAHIVRSKILQEALYQGQFPVRWIEWAWSGTAHPMFNFYQGGFYYIVAGLDLIIPSHIESIKIAVLLCWWLGSLFMFLLMKRFGNLTGALSALIFTFTPYIISDVFVRAAYPELAAISFTIGTLWGLDRSLRLREPIYAAVIAFCLLGIIISHLPTLVIMIPVILTYTAMIIARREAKLRGLGLAVIGALLGIGLAGFYILPALGEIKYIKSDLLTSNYYDFHPHFVYLNQLINPKWGYGISKEGPDDEMSFQFGLLQWAIILTAAVSLTGLISPISKFFASQIKLSPQTRISLGFLFILILYATFFMHDISIFFWEGWPFLSFIQYPWRFLMVVAVAAALMAGLLFYSLQNHLPKILAIFVCFAAVLVLYTPLLKPSTFVKKSDFDIDAPDWRSRPGIIINSFVEAGYLPKDVESIPARDASKWQVVEHGDEPVKSAADSSHSDKVVEKDIKYHHYQFATNSQAAFILRLHVPYFPGWKAFVNHRQVQINHDNKYQFMMVAVPANINNVEVKFTDTPIRTAANLITSLSSIALIVWQVYIYNRWRLKL